VNLPRINQNWLLLLVAILLGGGAAFLGNRMVQRHMQALDEEARRANQPIPVVVAKRDLLPGDALTSDNFAVRQVPREFVNADAMTPEGFGQLEHQRLAVGMKRGDMLLPVHAEGAGSTVFSATLKNGRRAMTFEVDTVNSVSGMLRPGDRIDLMLSQRGENSQEEVTRTLLSNMVVLATDQNLKRRDEKTGQETNFSTVTLDLSPKDAQRLIVAKQAGKLTALLRHPDDQSPNPTQALTAAGLFGGRRVAGGAGEPLQVEYIVGGNGGGPAAIQKQVMDAMSHLLPAAATGLAPQAQAAAPAARAPAPLAPRPDALNPGALPNGAVLPKSAAQP